MKYSDIQVEVVFYENPDDWYEKLSNNEIHLGMTYKEVGRKVQNQNNLKNIKLFCVGNEIDMLGYVVNQNSNIRKLSDLKKMKVAKYRENGTNINPVLEACLNTGSLTWDDVDVVELENTRDGLVALSKQVVDAAFMGDPHTPFFKELNELTPFRGLDIGGVEPNDFDSISQTVLENLELKRLGLKPKLFNEDHIESIIGLSEPSYVVVSEKLSDTLVYKMITVLMNHCEELKEYSNWFDSWEPNTMLPDTPSLEYHEGVLKYLK